MPSRFRSRVRLQALAGAFVLASVGPVAACQDGGPSERGVILEVSSTEVERGLNEEQAEALKMVQGPLCGLIGSFLNVVGPPITDADLEDEFWDTVNPDDTFTGICDQGEEGPINQQPKIVKTEYTIYIRSDLMAVVAANQPMVVWRVAGGRSEMWFVDPTTGEATSFGRLQAIDEVVPLSAIGVQGEGPKGTGKADVRLGYTVHHYETGHQVAPEISQLLPLPRAPFRVVSSGEAWIAHDTPYNQVVAAFFDNFAAGAAGPSDGMLSGLTSEMARLAGLGLPLLTTDTTSARILLLTALMADQAGGAQESAVLPDELVLKETVTVTNVMNVRWATPEEDLSYYVDPSEGAEGEDEGEGENEVEGEDGCDCSCGGFEEFKQLDKNDPGAIAKAQCVQHCGMKWATQCQG